MIAGSSNSGVTSAFENITSEVGWTLEELAELIGIVGFGDGSGKYHIFEGDIVYR